MSGVNVHPKATHKLYKISAVEVATSSTRLICPKRVFVM